MGTCVEVQKRISKIIGQLRGISKMIEKGCDCTEILTQLRAVIGAIKSLAALIATKEVEICKAEGESNRISSIMDRIVRL